MYYLEVPPSLFAPIVEQLGAAKLLRDGRVAVEKPFGHDLASARELNARLHRLLRESQILRVDHFLGKEPVIELEYLRFANLALAELWDRKSVSCVQITMAEDFGVEGRGAFYDSVGALRDVVQNHLLQVLALVAMDPPAGDSDDDTQDKKAEVFRAMPPADPQHYVRGQYQGYAEVPGVAPVRPPRPTLLSGWRSTTGAGPTSRSSCGPARRCRAGSPRCGCSCVARPGWPSCPSRPGRNPTRSCCGSTRTRACGCNCPRCRTVLARGPPGHVLRPRAGRTAGALRALLHAAIAGDHQLFARQDGVEETWRIVQPLLEHPPGVLPYPRGSWGPEDAETLVRGHPRWQEPWLPEEG